MSNNRAVRGGGVYSKPDFRTGETAERPTGLGRSSSKRTDNRRLRRMSSAISNLPGFDLAGEASSRLRLGGLRWELRVADARQSAGTFATAARRDSEWQEATRGGPLESRVLRGFDVAGKVYPGGRWWEMRGADARLNARTFDTARRPTFEGQEEAWRGLLEDRVLRGFDVTGEASSWLGLAGLRWELRVAEARLNAIAARWASEGQEAAWGGLLENRVLQGFDVAGTDSLRLRPVGDVRGGREAERGDLGDCRTADFRGARGGVARADGESGVAGFRCYREGLLEAEVGGTPVGNACGGREAECGDLRDCRTVGCRGTGCRNIGRCAVSIPPRRWSRGCRRKMRAAEAGLSARTFDTAGRWTVEGQSAQGRRAD